MKHKSLHPLSALRIYQSCATQKNSAAWELFPFAAVFLFSWVSYGQLHRVTQRTHREPQRKNIKFQK